MAVRKTEPWLQKSHIELKAYVKDRGEKFIDAESRKSNREAILLYTTEPVYVKFIKFATDKFQNIRTRHWDSGLPERRNEVKEKFLKPLECAIRDGLAEWKTSEDKKKLMEAPSISFVNTFVKLCFTEGKYKKSASMVPSDRYMQRPLAKGTTTSTAQWQPVERKPTEWKPTEWKPTEWKPTEWKPTEWKPTEWYGGSSETTPTTSGRSGTRNYMNRSSELKFQRNFRVDYGDGNTLRFGFHRRF